MLTDAFLTKLDTLALRMRRPASGGAGGLRQVHGGAIVATVLASEELRGIWEAELKGMRERIKVMRTSLVEKLKAKGVARDFSFIAKQRGMFSYTGLSADQVARLQSEFGIYAVSTGRICLAALNTRNIDYVAEAIAAVL